MNKTLIKALEEYFYSDAYDDRPDSNEINEAQEEVYNLIDPIREKDSKLFYAIETAIGTSEMFCQKQGFLRGYEHALTLMGMNNTSGGGYRKIKLAHNARFRCCIMISGERGNDGNVFHAFFLLC